MITNFPNGVSSFGIQLPSGDLPATKGKYIFVDYGSGNDGNTGKSPEEAVKTISQAYSMATTNMDDVIVLMGSSTHVLSSMLTVSKNRVHFVGVDASGGRMFGQNAKVSLGSTTAATDIGTMQNTGVRNSFHNIKFMNSNDVAEGIYCVVEAGEYAKYTNCEFYKSTDLDVTGAAEVANNGDSAQWIGCTFGSSANIIADAKIRPNMLLTGGIVSGKKCRDNYIQDCIFLSKAGGNEHVAIYGANATDVERMFLVKNSVFYNNILSVATPDHAVGFGAAQTEGCVILKDCTSVDHTVMAQAAMNIYVDGAVPTFATTGVSVAS
jgi:hypothetical protein